MEVLKSDIEILKRRLCELECRAEESKKPLSAKQKYNKAFYENKRKTGKVFCLDCEMSIDGYYYEKHCATLKHAENASKK